MSLVDLQGRSPTTSVYLKCDSSYSCAAVDKISIDYVIERRAVPQQQLILLF